MNKRRRTIIFAFLLAVTLAGPRLAPDPTGDSRSASLFNSRLNPMQLTEASLSHPSGQAAPHPSGFTPRETQNRLFGIVKSCAGQPKFKPVFTRSFLTVSPVLEFLCFKRRSCSRERNDAEPPLA